jgi:hypothetical protein
MKTIIINRDVLQDDQTLGVCYIKSEKNNPKYVGFSLERGWKNNQNNISCIPEGTYKVVLEYSDRFKTDLWEIKGVPNRAECKFHSANYWYQLNGCIALGRKRIDINSDGYADVTSSRDVMNEFHEILKGEKEAVLIVKNI